MKLYLLWRSKHYGRFVLPNLLATIAIVLIGMGCQRNTPADDGKKKGPAQQPPVPVVVTQAVERTMPVRVRAIGNVQAYSTVVVRSQLTGQLEKIHFEEGQDVKANEVLFTIDQRPFAGMLQQAKANLARDTAQLDSSRLNFEREKKLWQDALVPQSEYETAEANYKALQGTVLADQASVSNATLNLEFTTIRSPINGRTGNLLAHQGNIVKAPDDQLLTINQVQPIYVSFSVPEQYLPEIRQRLKDSKLMVEASYDNMPGKSPRGELTFIDNAVDSTTGTIQLKATFPNTDNVLWPGQFVQTSLILSEVNSAVVVPSQAIQSGQKGDFVYVVKADQSVELRNVEPDLVEHGETMVKRGLTVGETVVIDGQSRLVPGAKITSKPPVEGRPLTKEEIGGK